MKKKNGKSIIGDYLILGVVLAIGVILFLFLPPIKYKKEVGVLVMAAFYIFWSIWFHSKKGNLEIRIVLEYIVIAALGVALLLALI